MNKLSTTTTLALMALLIAAMASAQEQTQTQQHETTTSDTSSATTSEGSDAQSGKKMQQAATNPQDKRTQDNQVPVVIPFVTLVVPVDMTKDDKNPMRSGCWAKLYADQNYKGDTFTLVGPVSLSNMEGPFGVNWEDVSSIQAGPQARVTIYDNMNFRDRAASIKPGQNVPELNDKLGFFEEIESMKIDCSQAESAAARQSSGTG